MMRSILLFSLVISMSFYSCHRKPETQDQPPPAPKALEKSTEASFSKRGPDDLVESLYNELKKESPALEELEKRIDGVQQQKEDSTAFFENFDQKNNSYYTATDRHIASIQDSLLKQNIQDLIRKSLDHYSKLTQSHQQWIRLLDSKNVSLNDLYMVLKLTKTVSVMEKYQQSHLPSVQPLQAVNQAYDNIIQQTAELAKKE